MKALIYNGDTLVSICEDGVDFDVAWIKDLYGDGELTTQHIDMTTDQFRKHPHSIVDGQIVVDVDTIIDIPESPKEPTLEEKINLQIAQNTAETLEVLTTLNEMQKIEQAQSNAEMIELILSLNNGGM